MADRKLIVQVIGDTRSLEKAFGRSTKQAQSFSVAMKGVGRSTSGFGRGLRPVRARCLRSVARSPSPPDRSSLALGWWLD